jgi:hypothetical protein
MPQRTSYGAEIALVCGTMLVGLLGFWTLYIGPEAAPQPHHHLHVATSYLWMALLLYQLLLLRRGESARHRRFGLAVLVAGPLLVASAALLTVHSAERAIASGKPDALLLQNIMGTLWLAALLVLAFVLRRRRQVHGALLASTMLVFLGPALFFALIAFAPPFRIEGPETFYRFQTAGMTGQAIIVVLAVAMFLRDRRSHWPYLFAASAFLLGEAIKGVLAGAELIDPLTRLVATPHPLWTFAVVAVGMALLLATMVLPTEQRRPALT